MLSKRIIASIIVKDGFVVQSIGFQRYLPVGSPEIAVEFFNEWGADEITVLDISASGARTAPNPAFVNAIAKKSLVPLAVGGGVDSIETMRMLVRSGADKIVINRSAIENPTLISEAAKVFGSQCVVVSIDAKETIDGQYEAYIDSGRIGTGKTPVEVAKNSAEQGAGEILIRSINRDGSRKGFDVELAKSVSSAVDIPVIAAGGCGQPKHIEEVFEKSNCDAVSVGNLLHFTEHSITTLKAFLEPKFPIRLDTYATYADSTFDCEGRLCKKDDDVLEKMRFEYHPKEII